MAYRSQRAARALSVLIAATSVMTGIAATPVPQPVPAALPPASFTTWERHAYYAPLDDGVRIAVTLYTPAGGPATSHFPVLFWYLPGHRESIDPATGRLMPAYADEDLRFFTSQGYALAVA